jgi:hypothetical protein
MASKVRSSNSTRSRVPETDSGASAFYCRSFAAVKAFRAFYCVRMTELTLSHRVKL